MNKTLAKKALAITKRISKGYGCEFLGNLNEDPMNSKNFALYVDGDFVDRYWNNDGYGWGFQEEVQKAWDDAGIFVEPYTSTIFSVYNK